ncbi:hypothetical protein L9F63_009395, partial [Diploptera punctata]
VPVFLFGLSSWSTCHLFTLILNISLLGISSLNSIIWFCYSVVILKNSYGLTGNRTGTSCTLLPHLICLLLCVLSRVETAVYKPLQYTRTGPVMSS